MVQELTDFERPRHLTYRSDAMGNAELKFELSPAAGGTRAGFLARHTLRARSVSSSR